MFFLLGNGILGSEVAKVFHKKGKEIIQITRREMDMVQSSLDAICITVKTRMPPGSILINAAAYTNVDGAEKEKDKAFAVNASGPHKLAVACHQYNIHLVHFSTDFVFNGRKPIPYIESDVPDPINYYGYSKLRGEDFVRNSTENYTIIRTSWLYNDTHGIVPNLINIVRKNKEIRGTCDQISAPTHARSVAEQLYKLLEYKPMGIFHVTAGGEVTPYQLLKYLLGKIHSTASIWEIPTYSYFSGKAPRPRMCILENSVTDSLGINIMSNWKDDIDRLLNENK